MKWVGYAEPTWEPADALEDKKSDWFDKALKVNPHYGKVYEIAGHFFVINRRYAEGIADVDKNLTTVEATRTR